MIMDSIKGKSGWSKDEIVELCESLYSYGFIFFHFLIFPVSFTRGLMIPIYPLLSTLLIDVQLVCIKSHGCCRLEIDVQFYSNSLGGQYSV